MIVVLPAPFSPSSARTLPGAISKLTEAFASTPPKRLVTSSMRTSGVTRGPGTAAASRPCTGSPGRQLARNAFDQPPHTVDIGNGHRPPGGNSDATIVIPDRPLPVVELALGERRLLFLDQFPHVLGHRLVHRRNGNRAVIQATIE